MESPADTLPLRSTSKLFEDLCKTVRQVFWIYNPCVGAVEYITPDWREILRLPAGDEPSVLPLLMAENRPLSPAGLAELLQGRPTRYEHSVSQPDGTILWLAEQACPEMNAAGECIRIKGVVQDVTQGKVTEQHLWESQRWLVEAENRYRSLVSALSEGIILADTSGRFIECNTRTEQLLGMSRAEILNQDQAGCPLEVLREDETPYPHLEQPMEVTRLTGQPQRNVTLGIRRPDGSILWLQVNTQPLVQEGGATPCASVALFSDVSRERDAARQAQRQRDELTHTMRVASIGELASGLAHELNQPLTAITNYAFTARELLNSPSAALGDFTREKAAILELLDQIGAQAVRTGEIIRRLRRFISKSRPLHALHDINQIVQDAADLIAPEFQLARVPLSVSPGARLPRVVVDAIQLQQVLINLLKNALEAQLAVAPEGRAVRVSTRRCGPMLEIVVSDTGPGLSPAARERLFETFFTTKETGLGLGLPISRSLIEAHGGKLTLEGSDASGTTFLMTLPCECTF